MFDRSARAIVLLGSFGLGCNQAAPGIPDAAPPELDAAVDAATPTDAAPDAFVDPNARFEPAGYDGLPSNVIPDLAAPCAIDATAGTLALEVRDGETVYVGVRASDQMVVASARTSSGASCVVPTAYAIAIAEDPAHAGAEHVLLDYADGSPGAVTLALGAGSSLVVRGWRGGDVIAATASTIEMTGGASPDVQFSGVSELVISTGPGDDTVTAPAFAGTFSAFGGPGRDTLSGGTGGNLLDGGDGDDTFPQVAVVTERLVGGKGVDTVDYGTRTAAVRVTVCTTCTGPDCATCIADDGAVGEADTVNDDIERVFGTRTGDTIDGSHAACSDGASTPAIGCTFRGNEGDDAITGSAFADTIEGGNGNDLLLGGLGDDTIAGGSGIDTVSYAGRMNAVAVSLDSTKLWSPGQNGEAGELDTLAADIENLTGGPGADSLRGSSSANIVRGGFGNDVIEGGPGNDSLYGDGDADAIYGGPGNDMLVGGAGADAFYGGDGDDFLDSSDAPATADMAIDCDGVNSFAGAASTLQGTADALVRDGADAGAQHCEL